MSCSALTAAMATADARKPVVIFRPEKGPDDPYAKVGKIGSRAGDSLAMVSRARLARETKPSYMS